MISNHIKFAWRSLTRNKFSSFINIGGLSVGMAVAMLIGLWVWDELSFDHWHQHHAHIVEVMDTQVNNGHASVSGEVAIPLQQELEHKYGSWFRQLVLTTHINPVLLGTGEKKLSQMGAFVQPAFTSLFSLQMLKGRADALKDPSSLLLSRSAAAALYGEKDPMGQVIDLNGRLSAKVAGVYEDLPVNTTLSSVKFLGSWDKFIAVAHMQEAQTQWGNHSFFLYALMNEEADPAKVDPLIKDLPERHMPGSRESIFLHPMDRWHLYSDFSDGKAAGGRIRFVWLFSIIGAFVLLLACINFMNLSTARSEKRAKEVGIRKAIGSLRGQLIRQFLTESLLMAFLALAFALALVQLSLPFFNSLTGKQMLLPVSAPLFWVLLLVFTCFTGLISGSYPAFYLSGADPIRVLKGNLRFKAGRFAALPRRVLVVVQFTVSIALILGTLVVFRQIRHAQNRPVGYSRAGLISLPMYAQDAFTQYGPLRNDLLQTGVVQDMGESSSPSTHIWNHYGDLDWEGKDPRTAAMFGIIAVTHEYGRTIGWQLKEGRDFSTDFPTDSGSFILNEAAVRLTGFKEPVGKLMQWEGKSRRITGVVKDLVMESPYESVKPTIFFLQYNDWLDFLTIRIRPEIPLQQALAAIGPVYKRYNTGNPFDYQFVSEEYAKKFSDEQRIGNLATVFATLAIFISCLGLFGLASYITEQRTREIGVRKVLGASVFSLWRLLSGEFVFLVVLSCCIAGPGAYYFMHGWLQRFTYRTEISWWLFAATGLGAILITLLTVSYQSIRSALANPVKSLKAE